MKKLIIALAAICCVGILQAASVTWTLSAVQKSDASGAASGYLAMVFDATTAQSDVIAAIMAKDTSALSSLANNWKQDTTTTSAGLLRSAGNGNYSASDTFEVYAVIFDAGSVADANNYFMTASKAGNIAANGANANFSFGTFASQVSTAGSSGGWVAVAVPEPTSGLLMLLGMASLALKRKRA